MVHYQDSPYWYGGTTGGVGVKKLDEFIETDFDKLWNKINPRKEQPQSKQQEDKALVLNKDD